MGSNSRNRGRGRTARAVFYLAILACTLGSRLAQAQTSDAPPAKTVAPEIGRLARFVPKENLAVYIEFTGIDAHEAAWKNSASAKMLTGTTLGEVLEAVSEQLIEKALSFVPGHRLSGSDIVKLAKYSARSGWVVALNADAKARSGYRGTFVLRGGASKDNRALTSPMMGWLMGASKAKVETKAGRDLVVVPASGTQANASDTGGWVWWAEKDDLVIGFLDPGSAVATIAVLDGKAPSAAEHALIKELAMPQGKFEPVCFGFLDPAVGTASSNGLATLLHSLKAERGVDRIDLQWGFEGDALLSMMRLVSAKPRKGLLAAFDGATFNKASLLPLPDQVKSFVATSVNPRHFVELIKQMTPSDEGKEQVEEVAKSVRGKGSIDIEKDVLGLLGPRMIAYVAGRSAVTNDDAMGSEFQGGLSLSGVMSAMQSNFPKLTIVSDVKNPEAFSKGLDALMVAINGKLKEQAVAKAKEDREEAEKKDEAGSGTGTGAGTGRGGAGGRPGGAGGGDRTKTRKTSPSQTTAPRFELTSSSAKGKLFILSTPRTSPLQFGPSSFKPTVEFDGERVAFAVSPEAAKNALATARKKDWKPSGDLAKALENVENNVVVLGVSDVSETLPGVLASLPGTLQTMLNTTWALAKANAGPDAGASQPTTPGAGGAAPVGGAPGRRGGMALPGGGMQAQGGGGQTRGAPGRGGANQMTAAGSNNAGAAGDSAIVFNIDAAKLPKASDLKAYLFPSTVTISVTDQDIRIVSREAFPDLGSLINSLPILGMTPGGKALVDSAKAASAGQTPGAAATGGAEGGAGGATPPAAGAAAPTTKATLPGGAAGGRGAGRRRDE